MRWFRLLVVALALLSAPHALAVQPDEIMADPALEARARVLSKELRCMVCQNQSIDDSDAPLARDLRLLVRERLKGGDSDSEVMNFLVARYGDFVLLRPPFHWYTALLWLGPPAAFIGGALILVVLSRRRTRRGAADVGKPEGGNLTDAEEARLARLINPRET
jgi:cytochrome c-type biogenesis protein CcmH